MIVEKCMYVQQYMLKLHDESYKIPEHKRMVTQVGYTMFSSVHVRGT